MCHSVSLVCNILVTYIYFSLQCVNIAQHVIQLIFFSTLPFFALDTTLLCHTTETTCVMVLLIVCVVVVVMMHLLLPPPSVFCFLGKVEISHWLLR